MKKPLFALKYALSENGLTQSFYGYGFLSIEDLIEDIAYENKLTIYENTLTGDFTDKKGKILIYKKSIKENTLVFNGDFYAILDLENLDLQMASIILASKNSKHLPADIIEKLKNK
jgi:hypothetical protein